MTDVQNPVAQPLGGPSVSGTQVTVDVLTKSVTVINQTVRNLVAANEGYFIERVFSPLGNMLQGGAALYTESFPEDHFLDPDQDIAPRAPGSEAPRIGSLRRAPKVAKPESWSGSIEVTDEARRRNDVIAVDKEFRAAANSFTDKIQTRGIAVLNAAVSAWSRQVVSTVNWRAALSSGVPNADPTDLPQADFAAVLNQFVADKTGVRPDTLIIHQDDALYLDIIYGDKLDALLRRYNLTMIVTPLATEGSPLFVKAGTTGAIIYEKGLDTEYTREGKRFTDVYTMEVVPLFVAHDASGIIQLTGIDS